MNGDSGEKEPPDEEREVKYENVGDGRSSLRESELKVDGNINDGGDTSQGSLQVQRQQLSQGTPFCWDRFLHIRSIKVLLVENDDSTRHIVTALLRNCNYEVIEASNGLQAWKVLEDLTNHVDLILTEVVMPCLSGIGLLCKIMSHKSRKNVPVIMMSSHDSMGLVFKCLSKGAVDFLVKPIRKNELKNLWQHVWRRCHSSSGSGSGSESGTQTPKSIQSKSSEKSENNSGSNDREDDGSNGLNIGDGSDDGSGTQSSWTKLPIEVDSSREASPADQVADCQDSTCAQVIHSNAEASPDKRLHKPASRKYQQEVHPGQPVDFESKPENPIEAAGKHISAKHDSPLKIEPSICSNTKDKNQECPNNDNPSNKHQVVCTTRSGPETEWNKCDALIEHTNGLDKKNNVSEESEYPGVELSIKRLRGVRETGKGVQDDHNILRRSELSAFLRYNASSAFRAPNGITGSSSVLDNSPESGKKETDFQDHSIENPLNLSSKLISDNIDMGSTTNKLYPSPLNFLSEASSTNNGLHPSSAFNSLKDDIKFSRQVSFVKQTNMQSTALLAPPRGSCRDLQIKQPHHHHHHHHHYHINHFHNFEQNHPMSTTEDLSMRKSVADAPHCGSSNIPGGPGETNPINNSLDRSASGSNYGSNGHNGSSNAVIVVGTNGESDTGFPLQSGCGDANRSGSGNGIDQDRLSQREAALTKFRQKRKERCFKKQVRYQNRKRLAELRPRLRGQFVRQIGQESSSNETDE